MVAEHPRPSFRNSLTQLSALHAAEQQVDVPVVSSPQAAVLASSPPKLAPMSVNRTVAVVPEHPRQCARQAEIKVSVPSNPPGRHAARQTGNQAVQPPPAPCRRCARGAAEPGCAATKSRSSSLSKSPIAAMASPAGMSRLLGR